MYPNRINHFKVAGYVKLSIDKHSKKNEMGLAWRAGAINDLVADAVLNILLDIKEGQEPLSASETSLLLSVSDLLKQRYNYVNLDLKTLNIHLKVDDCDVTLLRNGKV